MERRGTGTQSRWSEGERMMTRKQGRLRRQAQGIDSRETPFCQRMNQNAPRLGLAGRWLPAIQWLGSYNRAWLRADLVAGLTAAAVVVPQAMAYGAIAGLPLVVGLYTALVPLVVYAAMGTSRPLSVTTTSTIAILTAHAIHEVAPDGSDASLIAAAGTLAGMVGAMLLAASLLRLGIIASLISDPVLTGF